MPFPAAPGAGPGLAAAPLERCGEGLGRVGLAKMALAALLAPDLCIKPGQRTQFFLQFSPVSTAATGFLSDS